jgi:hypothetical protein
LQAISTSSAARKRWFCLPVQRWVRSMISCRLAADSVASRVV